MAKDVKDVKDVFVVVRISEESAARLEKIVAVSRLGTRSDHMRKALLEYIERNEPVQTASA